MEGAVLLHRFHRVFICHRIFPRLEMAPALLLAVVGKGRDSLQE